MPGLHDLNLLLNSYQSTDLPTLENMDLMDRQDVKSFFHVGLLPELISTLQSDYYVLELQKKRIFQYHTLYFDTPDLKFYHAHHNGRLKRYKTRYRNYVDSGQAFFEVKLKNNKERNIKHRVEVDTISDQLCDACKTLINKFTPLNWEQLIPTLSVDLQRISLVSKDFLEKVTIDLNIKFQLNGKTKNTNGLAIAEVKRDRYSLQSVFLKAQHELKIYPDRISKYCLGMVQLKDDIKYNRFKPGMLKLGKIIHQEI